MSEVTVADALAKLPERITSKVEFNGPGGCWLWTACTVVKQGIRTYGSVYVGGRMALAHRLFWSELVGPIPDGMQIDHKCWVKACVNPGHLQVVTNAENQQNRPGAYRCNRTGIRGVGWDQGHQKWATNVRAQNLKIYVGFFTDIRDAEHAAILARSVLFTNSLADVSAVGSYSQTAIDAVNRMIGRLQKRPEFAHLTTIQERNSRQCSLTSQSI